MQNIKIELEYDGTNFFGWEIQPKKRTVRSEIENLLQNVLHEKIKLIGAARTDAGVHAICQVANFKTKSSLPITKIKNALFDLPRDIYVKNVIPVPLEFNARRGASSKVYLYKILLGKSPIQRARIWEYTFPLDIEKIKGALQLFIGLHQFDLFSFRDHGECDVKKFELVQNGDEVIFEIEANRFLHKMVRMIIGTLTELGRNKIEIRDIKDALELKGKKWLCAPPHGLYLKEVKY
ncbi:MAG: tRNA pseudouridine(38-40) synthase TruA [bacterium]|nr:tRNA pseudouridine(38-40) synthase TruA [bacterium]